MGQTPDAKKMKKLPEGAVVYYDCDPLRNIECTKESCFLKGGECRYTLDINKSRGTKCYIRLPGDDSLIEGLECSPLGLA